MTRLSTEGRVFAIQFFRQAREVEARHAACLSPGAATWPDSLLVLCKRMKTDGSPIKQAVILKRAITVFNSIDPKEAMHVGFIGDTRGKRSAILAFATISAGQHPLEGVDEEGLSFLQHAIRCGRSGIDVQADVNAAYISKHAVGRLYERNHRLTPDSAYGIFTFIGVLGLITRLSDKHTRGELCPRCGDILAVGSLKHALAHGTDGSVADGSFLDVRTVLDANEVRDRARLEQGRIAHEVVAEWLRVRTIGRAKVLAEQIPFLPRREDDFTLKMAVRA